ncbi:cyclin-dependent kinase 5 activator 1 [Exaiptasia diaphana]|uniref:Cyclin-dependent kinase 5 activator n=1 Tax=Exaiptasia diaphana TaxID=2652724 RepID=A0A913WUA0_EXADI|nr:cyclin-dependent kinase 5 activator 1 [Exaiptasia diaphana]KXJ17779.1 Cyclin-dependent kinase 5 activator 1 [Exaiptasia diaphana]
MGASFSVNRKALFRDCTFWNLKTREQAKSFYCKCCCNVSEAKDSKPTSFTSCDSLAAYLQKCASVGKKKMKSKIEPAPSKKPKDNVYEIQEKKDESIPKQIVPVADTKPDAGTTVENSLVKPQQRPKSSSFTLSSDALRCIGNFVKSHCKNLSRLRSSEVVLWLRGVDRALLIQGWQDQAFLTPPNLVFLYMLLKESLKDKFTSVIELRAEVLTCLYMAYTYSGPEISYPLKPFLVDGDRDAFWDRCVNMINDHSGKMLRTNRDPKYFGELLVELKCFNSVDRRDG